jgi:hypothetical protein
MIYYLTKAVAFVLIVYAALERANHCKVPALFNFQFIKKIIYPLCPRNDVTDLSKIECIYTLNRV